MAMHSSSLQTRIRRNRGSRAIGRNRAPLVTISGTERMNSTPLSLMAAMMPEPLSSIPSSASITGSASMRNLRTIINAEVARASTVLPNRKSNTAATVVDRWTDCGLFFPCYCDAEDDMKPVAVAFAAALVGAGASSAADWPTRARRIIAPSTPGGAADMFGRLLCEHFSEIFHDGCFVENRAGAGGLIGTAATAQAPPDGYTLTTSSTAYHVIAPLMSANPSFDPMKDFTHIAYIGGPPNVFVINPALGVRSLPDLVALGRRGQAIDYVSPGVGTLGHLLAELFARQAGIKLQQIMTKGASQAMMDLVAGTVPLATMTWTSALAQIRAGTVIPLAITSRTRLNEFPDLPTFKELGYDDLTAVSWFGLSGP